MQSGAYQAPATFPSSPGTDASGLQLLAQLAKFKAFNESMDTENTSPWDEVTAMVLQLGKPDTEKANTEIDKSKIRFDIKGAAADQSAMRCEAIYVHDGIEQKVWIEWKEYDYQRPGSLSPPPLIIERVQKLAALLRH